jgi:hypothetical protein
VSGGRTHLLVGLLSLPQLLLQLLLFLALLALLALGQLLLHLLLVALQLSLVVVGARGDDLLVLLALAQHLVAVRLEPGLKESR